MLEIDELPRGVIPTEARKEQPAPEPAKETAPETPAVTHADKRRENLRKARAAKATKHVGIGTAAATGERTYTQTQVNALMFDADKRRRFIRQAAKVETLQEMAAKCVESLVEETEKFENLLN